MTKITIYCLIFIEKHSNQYNYKEKQNYIKYTHTKFKYIDLDIK